MITVMLYTTAGCHLCELAIEQLQKIKHEVKIQPTEIGDDDSLATRYGATIPVLKFTDNSELNWPFTHQDIERHIKQL